MTNPTLIIDKETTSFVESIIGENGEAQPVFRKKLIRTADYIARITSQLGSDCHVLPRNCRLNIPCSGGARVLVIEEAPRSRHLKFDWDFVEETRTTKKSGQAALGLESLLEGQQIPYSLRIQLPYIVFLLFVQEKKDVFEVPYCRVFFRNHPLGASGDYLGYANLFNVSSGNEVCFGGNKRSWSKQTHTLSSAVEELIALYWAAPFAAEYRCRHDKYKNTPPMNSFLAWSMASQKPTFGFNIPLIMHDKTLYQEIDTFVVSRTVPTFERVFVVPLDEQLSGGNGSTIYQNFRLVESVVSIGDKLIYEEADWYIDTIRGNFNTPKQVELVNLNNEKITVELTPALLAQWETDVAAQRTNYLQSLTVDGKTVSSGTIIKIKSMNTYEVVDKIRLARDNTIEFVIGSKFFLALDGTYDVIDSVKAGDTELVSGKDYVIFNNQYRTYFTGRMLRIQNNSYNILHIFFGGDGDERGISVDSIYNGDFSIFEANDPRITQSRTFRFLDQIITDRDFRIVKGIGIFSSNDSSNIWSSTFFRETALEDILTNDGTKLHIPSYDVDINFSVGDEVVCPNWNNPDTIGKIWTITAFARSNGYLNFELRCGEETTSSQYINLSNGRVYIGSIRKASKSLNGIEVGLIQAKNPGILGFPKKVINRIDAFIVDGEKPLILCGNGLTITVEDLTNNFNVVTSARTPETINLAKIPWQTGDLCTKSDNLFVFNDDNTYLGKLYMLIDPVFVKTGSFRSKAVVSSQNNPDFKRYGILDPRLSKNHSHVVYESLPNFVNGNTHTFSDGYYPSTIPNVSEDN